MSSPYDRIRPPQYQPPRRRTLPLAASIALSLVAWLLVASILWWLVAYFF